MNTGSTVMKITYKSQAKRERKTKQWGLKFREAQGAWEVKSEMKDVWEVARPKELEKVPGQKGQSGTESKMGLKASGSGRTQDELWELGGGKRCQDKEECRELRLAGREWMSDTELRSVTSGSFDLSLNNNV